MTISAEALAATWARCLRSIERAKRELRAVDSFKPPWLDQRQINEEREWQRARWSRKIAHLNYRESRILRLMRMRRNVVSNRQSRLEGDLLDKRLTKG